MIEEYKEKLKEKYDWYTSNISNDGMAISLNLASFMYMLCDLNKFEVLLDRGSGFSSYVLRRYANEQDFDVIVYSIDTHHEWLEKTIEFLKENNLNTDNIKLWNEFYNKEQHNKFDFILEDAKLDLRIKTFKKMILLLNEEGTVLWDDGHYNTHRNILKENSSEFEFIYDIKDITMDSYGRYGLLSTRNKNLKK